MRKCIALLIAAVVLVGCAAPKKMTIVKPPWVTKSPSFVDAIAAVGVAPPMVNPAAQRERAAHQARLELAKTMRTKVVGLIRDWVNENKDYFTDAGESLSYFESVSEEITSATLVGSEIKEYFKDEDGTLYALAVISKTQAIENMLDKMKKLSAEQTRIIQERAEEAFKRLEQRAKETQW